MSGPATSTEKVSSFRTGAWGRASPATPVRPGPTASPVRSEPTTHPVRTDPSTSSGLKARLRLVEVPAPHQPPFTLRYRRACTACALASTGSARTGWVGVAPTGKVSSFRTGAWANPSSSNPVRTDPSTSSGLKARLRLVDGATPTTHPVRTEPVEVPARSRTLASTGSARTEGVVVASTGKVSSFRTEAWGNLNSSTPVHPEPPTSPVRTDPSTSSGPKARLRLVEVPSPSRALTSTGSARTERWMRRASDITRAMLAAAVI